LATKKSVESTDRLHLHYTLIKEFQCLTNIYFSDVWGNEFVHCRLDTVRPNY